MIRGFPRVCHENSPSRGKVLGLSLQSFVQCLDVVLDFAQSSWFSFPEHTAFPGCHTVVFATIAEV